MTIRDFSNTTWTYYTVAIFSWSYGLTDLRKHEFELTLTVDTIPTALGDEKRSSLPQYFRNFELDSAAKNSNLFKKWLKNKGQQIIDYLGWEQSSQKQPKYLA
jgi:hypothetical protein